MASPFLPKASSPGETPAGLHGLQGLTTDPMDARCLGRRRTQVRRGSGFACKAHGSAFLRVHSTQSPRLAHSLLPLQILCPFSFNNEVSLQFEVLLDRMYTVQMINGHPEGSRRPRVMGGDWKGRMESVLPLSLFNGKIGSSFLKRAFDPARVSRRGRLHGRNLKIWAKDHALGPRQDERGMPGSLAPAAGQKVWWSTAGMSPPKASRTQPASCRASAGLNPGARTLL